MGCEGPRKLPRGASRAPARLRRGQCDGCLALAVCSPAGAPLESQSIVLARSSKWLSFRAGSAWSTRAFTRASATHSFLKNVGRVTARRHLLRRPLLRHACLPWCAPSCLLSRLCVARRNTCEQVLKRTAQVVPPLRSLLLCSLVVLRVLGSFAGYDIVFVAGQSNAVGTSYTLDSVAAGNDDVGSMPVFSALFGIDGDVSYPGWDGSPGDSLGVPQIRKIPATGAGGLNDFVTCVMDAFLSRRPGRIPDDAGSLVFFSLQQLHKKLHRRRALGYRSGGRGASCNCTIFCSYSPCPRL